LRKKIHPIVDPGIRENGAEQCNVNGGEDLFFSTRIQYPVSSSTSMVDIFEEKAQPGLNLESTQW